MHQKTCPHTPAQYEVAQRMNRTMGDRVRYMLFVSGIGLKFWAEAAVTAVYLLNHLPTRSSKKPNFKHVRVFGCKAMVHEKRSKCTPKSKECIFVGYCNAAKGNRLFDAATSKIIVP